MKRKNTKMIALVVASLFGFTGFFEGEKIVGYWDANGKIATICSGHTKTAVVGQVKTKAECRELLSSDLTEAANIVDKYVQIKLPFNTYAAIVDFTFNVGEGNLAKSTLLKKLNKGDIRGACSELPKWVYSGGVKLNGLVKRRKAEYDLCLDY